MKKRNEWLRELFRKYEIKGYITGSYGMYDSEGKNIASITLYNRLNREFQANLDEWKGIHLSIYYYSVPECMEFIKEIEEHIGKEMMAISKVALTE